MGRAATASLGRVGLQPHISFRRAVERALRRGGEIGWSLAGARAGASRLHPIYKSIQSVRLRQMQSGDALVLGFVVGTIAAMAWVIWAAGA